MDQSILVETFQNIQTMHIVSINCLCKVKCDIQFRALTISIIWTFHIVTIFSIMQIHELNCNAQKYKGYINILQYLFILQVACSSWALDELSNLYWQVTFVKLDMFFCILGIRFLIYETLQNNSQHNLVIPVNPQPPVRSYWKSSDPGQSRFVVIWFH